MRLSEWFAGPNPRLSGAVRRKLIRRLVRAEEKVAVRCGLQDTVQCPVCGHTAPFFGPVPGHYGILHFGCECRVCGARERHRLQKMALDRLDYRSWCGSLLHFAPESCLASLLRPLPELRYVTADLLMPGVDVRLDLQALPFADQSFSHIICSHVLEHVPLDHAALRELRRVLQPDGTLLLCVPAVRGEERSREFAAPDPSLHGHLRAYGSDFVTLVADLFEVTDFSAYMWPLWQVLHHGLVIHDGGYDLLLACRPKEQEAPLGKERGRE